MPEIDFCLAANEERWLFDLILDAGLEFVVDATYPDREYTTIRRTDDALAAREEGSRLFFLSLPGTSEPLAVREHTSGPKAGSYFILQRNGGPVLTLLLPTLSEREDGSKQIAPGMLSYHRTYKSLAGESDLPIPEGLKERYKQLAKQIRSRGKRVLGKNRTCYVSPDVQSEVERGLRILGIESV